MENYILFSTEKRKPSLNYRLQDINQKYYLE